MYCPKCGTQNNENAKFCSSCGYLLMQATQTSEEQVKTVPPVKEDTSTEEKKKTVNTVQPTDKKSTNVQYFFVMLAALLKPATVLKEDLNKFNQIKSSAIMTLIITAIATIVKLITSMISAVVVREFSWSAGGYTTSIAWDNLSKLNYVDIIVKNFVIFAAIILAIAIVYYVMGLITKKECNFSRLLGISALAIVPFLICSLVLSPLLSAIWATLAVPVTLVGLIYTVIMVYEGMNSELKLESNQKYYVNLICLSILGIAGYYLYANLITESINDSLENFMDFLK